MSVFSSRRAMVSLFLLPVLAAVLLLPALPALAEDDPNTPWIVTRKADNRVLPKQDSVEDIEKGLADPAKPKDASKEAKNTAAKATDKPTEAEKKADMAPVAPEKLKKMVDEAKTPMVSGQASKPQVTVGETEIVIMMPTSEVVTDTRYLNLKNPRRLALDVMGSWKYSGQKKFPMNKGVLEKMELGKHPDFIRLVLHLTKGPVPGEIVPRFQLVEGGLQMTVPLK